MGENRSGLKFLGPSHHYIIKFIVLGLADNELLGANTVLTSVSAELDLVKRAAVRGMVENVQDTKHPDTDASVQVSTRQDDSRVLSSQLQS